MHVSDEIVFYFLFKESLVAFLHFAISSSESSVSSVDSDSAMKLNTQKAGKKKEAQNCKLCGDSAAHGMQA